MPKETKLSFKNDEYYAPSKPVKSSTNKPNVNLFEQEVKTETKVIPNNPKPHSTNSSTSQEFNENVNTKTVKSNNDQKKNFNISELDIDKLTFVLKDPELIQENGNGNTVKNDLNKIFSGTESTSQIKPKEGSNIFDSGIFGASTTTTNTTSQPSSSNNFFGNEIFETIKSTTITNTTTNTNNTNNLFTNEIFSQIKTEPKVEKPANSGFDFTEYSGFFNGGASVNTNTNTTSIPKTETINISAKSNKPIDNVSLHQDYDTMCEKLEKILKVI